MLIDKTQTISPRIFDVEGKLTPRPLHDLTRVLIVKSVFREAVQSRCPFVHLLEVADSKIDVIGIWLRLFAPGRHIDHRENHRTAVEIMPRASDPAARIVQQLRIELRSLVQIAYLQCYS